MKKIFAATMLATLAFAMTPSHAATTYLKFTGHVHHSDAIDPQIAGTPLAGTPLGTGTPKTQSDNCDVDGPNKGDDGLWIALPTGADKTDKLPVKLTFTDKLGTGNTDLGRVVPVVGRYVSPGTDMDLTFYSADCTALASAGTATLANPEVGVVPKDSAFALVNYFLGTDEVDFTLEIGTPPTI